MPDPVIPSAPLPSIGVATLDDVRCYRQWAEGNCGLPPRITLRLLNLVDQMLVALDAAGIPICRECGCSYANPCVLPSGTCAWVEPDDDVDPDLCTACAPVTVRPGLAVAS